MFVLVAALLVQASALAQAVDPSRFIEATASSPADEEALRGGELVAQGRLDDAIRVLRGACEAGSGLGCNNLSSALVHKGQPDEARVHSLRACELGFNLGCADYGYMLVQGMGGPRDVDQGYVYTARACAGGWPASCGEQAEMLIIGAGVASDPVAALPLLKLACDKAESNRFCGELGTLYEMGLGVEKDLATAEGYYGHSCRAGNVTACGRLPYVVRDAGDPARAYQIAEELCAQEENLNCAYQGMALLEGWGVKPSRRKARAVCSEACDRESFEACGCLVVIEMRRDPDSRAAEEAIERTCAADPQRCADMLGNGGGG